MKSLFKNGIYNVIKTMSSYVFPVITFAYASRILGETGIGRVSFIKSIISYFVMLAMLGMNYYGTREAAKLRDDRGALSQFAQEMLLINGCMTFVSCALAVVCYVAIPQLHEYGALFLVCALAIPLQGLGMEWLYQALEEYQYIAVRSMAFQMIALIAMLIFVRDEKDIVAYASVTLFASSGAYILNFINAQKYIDFSRTKRYEIKKHLKPLLWLFALAVSIELYTVLDSTMLGFLQGDAAVGRYTAAVKVHRIVNSLITAIGVVLIPRLSYYIGKNDDAKVKELVKQAYNCTFLLSVPAAVGLFMISDEIILLLSGNGFASAGTAMRIMTPIVVLIPFSMVTNQQTLVPLKKEKLILLSTLAGAVTNFTLNLILIPHYAENGAAAATVLAETVVSCVCLFNAKRFFDMKMVFKDFYQYLVAVLPIPVVVLLIKRFVLEKYIVAVASIIVSATVYFIILLAFKNQQLIFAYKKVYNKLKSKVPFV